MKLRTLGYVPLLAVLVACFAMLVAPISARAAQSGCRYNYTYNTTSCMTITDSGTYINYMRVQVHVPGFIYWCGTAYMWVQPPGQDFQSFKIQSGCAPNFTRDFVYIWPLYQYYPDESQACAEFTTNSGYLPVPEGPICFYVT